MINKKLQQLLSTYPDNMPIKLLPKQEDDIKSIVDFQEENIMLTSEKAWIDSDADPETWDCEYGKVRQRGKRFLLVNPIIM